MSWKEIEKELRGRFESSFTGWEWPNDLRIRVRLGAGALVNVVRFLSDSGLTRFITATALETPDGKLEVWYHFDFFQTPQTLSIVVNVPETVPASPPSPPSSKAPSGSNGKSPRCSACNSRGTPVPGGCFFRKGWPKAVHPMRKD